jgi:peptidoglycan hydrolase-like protein with peptidoglycan-binding domain
MDYKKISFLLVTITILFGLKIPNVKAAETNEEILKQIIELQTQIAALQEELKSMNPTIGWCHDFNINLRVGDEGTEVKALQLALGKDGDLVYDKNTNGIFDEYCASSVVAFQEKYKSEILTPLGLMHGTGYIGIATRSKLNKLFGCGIKVKKEELKTPTIVTPYNGEVINSISPLFIIFDIPENYVIQFGVWEGNKPFFGTDFLTWGTVSETGSNQEGPLGKFNWNKSYTIVARTCIDTTLAQCSDWSEAVTFNIVPKGTCIDSDQGKNYQTAGYATLNGEEFMEDTCLSDIKPSANDKATLMEYYCTGDQNNPAWFIEYKCPNGCKNGACINPSSSTYPSFFMTTDKQSYSKGDIISLSIKRGDSGTYPYYVDLYVNNLIVIKRKLDVSSPMGIITQIDTNLYEPFKSGSSGVYILGVIASGETVAGVTEGKYNTNSTAVNYFSIVSVTPACTDSDGGKNLYVKGTTTGTSAGSDYPRQVTMTDSCRDATHIFEYYCSNNANVINGLFGNYFESITEYCADGCIDGACKQISGVCGDGLCNQPETCTTCQVDCGICVPPAPILSPWGGEKWAQGTSQVIRWTPYGSVNSVIISLYQNGIYQKSLTGAIPDSGGKWTWNIPADQAIGSQYSIRVSRLSYPKDYIAKSNYFSIVEKSSITILYPNGGENWVVGNINQIRWSTTGFSSSTPVQIGLRDTRYNPNLGEGEAIIINTINSGSYSWTIPTKIGSMTLGAGNVYQIVIYIEGGGPGKNDLSDNYFSIISSSTTCTDSDGGEDFYEKGTITGLIHGDGITTLIDSCWPHNFYGDGYDYVLEYSCLLDSSDGKTYISNTNQKCLYGCVDGACKTSNASIRMFYPNGGEKLTKGERGEIRFCGDNFSTTGPGGLSHIYLLKGASVYGLIYRDNTSGIGGCPGGDIYYWTIGQLADGATVPVGDDYKIKVDFVTQSGIVYATGESNNYFSIVSTTNTCTESDGGKNYLLKGTCQDNIISSLIKTDSCGVNNDIQEYWCDQEHGWCGVTAGSCASLVGPGYVCKDGACIKPEGVCINHNECSQSCDNLGINFKWVGQGSGYKSWIGTCPSFIYGCMSGQCCLGQCDQAGKCFCKRTDKVDIYGDVCPSGTTCGSDCYCHPLVLTGTEINPYDADVKTCFGSDGKTWSVIGEGSAAWFSWGGCAKEKYYEVTPGQELTFHVYTDSCPGCVCYFPNFYVYEYENSGWVQKKYFDLPDQKSLTLDEKYTPNSNKIKISASDCFYLDVFKQ